MGSQKSVRKTHPVALGLIQAKVHTALAVLSCLLLPPVSYLYHALNAEDHLFMDTHLQHCCTIYRHLFAKNFTGSEALREAQHNAEGRTKVNKSNGKWRTTLHMSCLFEIPSQFTQRFSNTILLVSSPYHRSLS
jgi:ABC-type transport system involved in cytochrome bd biosynthesis fused ATPase/permease subunit